MAIEQILVIMAVLLSDIWVQGRFDDRKLSVSADGESFYLVIQFFIEFSAIFPRNKIAFCIKILFNLKLVVKRR
jgi:hypothetical protein